MHRLSGRDSLGPVRIFLGFLVAPVALAGAVYLHSGAKLHTVTFYASSEDGFGNPYTDTKPTVDHLKASWQDPLALFIAVAGVGAGVAIAVPGFRRRLTE